MSDKTPETPADTTPAELPSPEPPAAAPAQRRMNLFQRAAMEGMAEIAERKRRGTFVTAPEDENPWAELLDDDEN